MDVWMLAFAVFKRVSDFVDCKRKRGESGFSLVFKRLKEEKNHVKESRFA